MMNLEVKNKCREALLENLGFTCKEDEMSVEDFLVTGESEDILVEANFTVIGGKHFSYYYNFLTDTFRINSRHYDGSVVA